MRHEPNTTSSDGRGAITALAAAVVGGALLGAADGSKRHGGLLRALGACLLAGASMPALERRIISAGGNRRRIHLRMTTEIHRPVSEVFSFLKDFENFPQIVGSLRNVVDYQDGRSHWAAYAPSGRVIEWDVVVTKYMPNSVIAWESVPGGDVDAVGLVRFAPMSPDSTRLEIELSYAPHETALGDALHALAGMTREEQLERELARAAFYIESLPRTTEHAVA